MECELQLVIYNTFAFYVLIDPLPFIYVRLVLIVGAFVSSPDSCLVAVYSRHEAADGP